MADEVVDYILGEDVTDQFERPRNHGLVVSTRLERADARRLMRLAERSNQTVAQIAREAIKRYISEAERAARFQIEATWTEAGVLLAPESPRRSSGPIVNVVVAALSA